MSTVGRFVALAAQRGSDVLFHRADSIVPCPCRTPEGFRDPEWHFRLNSAMAAIGDELSFDANFLSPGPIANLKTEHYYIAAGVQGNNFILGPLYEFSNVLAGGFADGYHVIFPGVAPPVGFAGINQTVLMRQDGEGAVVHRLTGVIFPGDFDDVIAEDNLNAPISNFGQADECNEAGMLPLGITSLMVKAFVQPIQSTRATRLSSEYIAQMFGEVEADDHLGIFPCDWNGTILNFKDWSQAGEDFIEYNGERFLVINANLIPDPSDGNPFHHWEVGLRMIGTRNG